MVWKLYLTLETLSQGLCAACSGYTLRYQGLCAACSGYTLRYQGSPWSPWSKVLVQQKTRIYRTGLNHPLENTFSENWKTMEEKDDFQTQLGFRIVQCIHDTQYKCAVYSHRFGFNLLAQYLLFIRFSLKKMG